MAQICKSPESPKAASCCPGPIDEFLNPEFFKALSDQTRLSLLSCLAKCARPCSVSELAECCSVDLSVVSRHLKLLENADVVKSKKQGRDVRYEFCYAAVSSLLRALADAMDGLSPVPSIKKKPGKRK